MSKDSAGTPFLKTLWKKWLKISQAIGNFQGQVILGIFYIILISPIGILMRFFLDPLRLRTKKRSSFEKWEHEGETLEEARRQY